MDDGVEFRPLLASSAPIFCNWLAEGAGGWLLFWATIYQGFSRVMGWLAGSVEEAFSNSRAESGRAGSGGFQMARVGPPYPTREKLFDP